MPGTGVGRFGRILIGLGLMLLALGLVTGSATVLTQSAAVRGMLDGTNKTDGFLFRARRKPEQ